MSRVRALLAVVAAGALAQLTGVACGPPCVDDRCSLSATKQQTTIVDYTKKSSPPPTTAGPATGSAAGPVAAGSASGSAAPVTAGSGSGKPVAAGSAAPPTAGSAAPAPAPIASARWERWDGDQFKMHVISKAPYAASASVRFEYVKTPEKTPFVITLLVKAAGGSASEGIWNDCPDGKIKCDSGGTKTHTTKKAGQVMLQAGINWAVTAVSDEARGTLVTWTNNLSREVVTLRLLK
jgi:hypothetical protein